MRSDTFRGARMCSDAFGGIGRVSQEFRKFVVGFGRLGMFVVLWGSGVYYDGIARKRGCTIMGVYYLELTSRDM